MEKLHVQGDEIVAEYVTDDDSVDEDGVLSGREEGEPIAEEDIDGQGENRGDAALRQASSSGGGQAEGADGEEARRGGIRARIAAFFAGLCLLFNIGGSTSDERSGVEGDEERVGGTEEDLRFDRGVRGNRLRQGAKKTRHRRLVRIRRRKRVKVNQISLSRNSNLHKENLMLINFLNKIFYVLAEQRENYYMHVLIFST